MWYFLVGIVVFFVVVITLICKWLKSIAPDDCEECG